MLYSIWLIIIILMIIIELKTTTTLPIYFVVGALCSMILNVVYENFVVQFIVFVLVGAILYSTIRPNVEMKIFKNKLKHFKNNMIGRKGIVIKSINQIGEVKIDKIWFLAKSDTPLKKGEFIKVKKIEDNTLVVVEDKRRKK